MNSYLKNNIENDDNNKKRIEVKDKYSTCKRSINCKRSDSDCKKNKTKASKNIERDSINKDLLDKLKISIENVSKNYEGETILKNINMKVYSGEFVSIVGPSGCGKSTIFNMITNLASIDFGNINIFGEYSYMYQKDLLLPYKKIVDNVSLPLVLKGVNKKEARKKVAPFFKTFGLSGYEKKYPNELSGGMRQRANFMRTYINSDDIMLLDEPFGSLDSITRNSMQNWLLDMREKVNSSILMITHDIDEAIKLSDRIYVLSGFPATVQKEIVFYANEKNRLDIQKNICNEDNFEVGKKIKYSERDNSYIDSSIVHCKKGNQEDILKVKDDILNLLKVYKKIK
jgi:ABC-type nitrate/sulfonate/bicarbonate transport system ATPase subunit